MTLPETRAERVSYIASLMRRLKWVRGKSGKRLAMTWGIKEVTMRDYAAEAWRLVQNEQRDPEGAQTEALLEFRAVTKEARKLSGMDRVAGLRVRIEAAKSLAIVSGGVAPKKFQEVGRFDHMTPEQHREELAKLRAEIAEEEQRIDDAEGKGQLQ